MLDTQCKEENPWPLNGGYLNFVTDSRNDNYWRPYVGQSEKPWLRIQQHGRNIRKLKHDILHYYIIWVGHGYRTCNFIRLWTLILPDGLGVVFQITFNNILEMIMARAFQSLPRMTLEKWFSLSLEEKPFTSVGLNVISPLLQGRSLSPWIRHGFSLELDNSLDPEIRAWPEVKKRFLEENVTSKSARTIAAAPLLKVADYHAALHDAIKSCCSTSQELTRFENQRSSSRSDSVDVGSSHNECASRIEWDNSIISLLHGPFGNVKRIYLCAPAPIAALWANKWSEARQVGEIFRFSASITQTMGTWPYFYDTSLVQISIIRRSHNEKLGLVPEMTRETMGANFRDWLYRKGFVQEA